jgi:serine protease
MPLVIFKRDNQAFSRWAQGSVGMVGFGQRGGSGVFFAIKGLVAGVLAWSALCLTAPAHAATSPEPMAMGLIVKLKSNQATPGANSVVRLQASSLSGEAVGQSRQRLWAATRRHQMAFVVHKPTAFAAHLIHDGHPISLSDAQAQAERLRADPDVEWVVVNRLLQPAGFVTGQPVSGFGDPQLPSQKWLQARDVANGLGGVADFPAAWQLMAGRSLTPVAVAVLDTGILPAPDLAGRSYQGYDFVSDAGLARDGSGLDANPTDEGDWLTPSEIAANPQWSKCEPKDASSWHGLSISALLAATTGNGLGGGGIMAPLPGQVLLPVRVAGACGASVKDIIEGMLWAAGVAFQGSPPLNPNPARVISLSFGGDGSCADGSNEAWLYRQTVAALAQKGALLVASAGNGDASRIGLAAASMPSNCPGVLAATGLNQVGYKATYANFVNGISETGVAVASGDARFDAFHQWIATDDGITTTTNFGTTFAATGDSAYGMINELGTSYAAPSAAGVAALVLAVDPSLSAAQLLTVLTTQTQPFLTAQELGSSLPVCRAGSSSTQGNCLCTQSTCGSGMLDANRAVAWAIQHVTDNPNLPAYTSGTVAVSLDRPTDAIATGKGGGGGAMDGWALWGLAAALAWQCHAGWSNRRAQGGGWRRIRAGKP